MKKMPRIENHPDLRDDLRGLQARCDELEGKLAVAECRATTAESRLKEANDKLAQIWKLSQ
jgi:hypothetical protein